MACHFPLPGIFPTQGLNPCLLHCRQILYHLRHQGRLLYREMLSNLPFTFKNIKPPSKGLMPALLYSEPLTPQQATVDPCLCQRLLDTHRQVWPSLLWGHCSFLLDPGAHEVLFVPSNSLFLQSCGSSVIKSHWPPKSNFLGVFSPFARSPGWGIC